MSHPRTREILSRFPDSTVVEIDHYKDVFCRRKQDYSLQNEAQALILAMSEGSTIYEGAQVCQSFGNKHFYYCSQVMNCIFDCDYCYLKGMYPSGNMVIFVNIEDCFSQLEEILRGHSAYVCVSYDTDLMALEDILGYVKLWNDFTITHPELIIEIRTKSARTDLWSSLTPCDRVIFAFTLSPDEVVRHHEHHVGSLEGRVKSASLAMERGFRVRLCFDPMIYCPDWKNAYKEMSDLVFTSLDAGKLTDVSVGTFRISQDYMKKMRKQRPLCGIAQFPYENQGGVYQYPATIRDSMEEFMTAEILKYLPEDKIFRWE